MAKLPNKQPREHMAPGTVPCPPIAVYELTEERLAAPGYVAFFIGQETRGKVKTAALMSVYLSGETETIARNAATAWWQAEQDRIQRNAEIAEERSERMKRRHGEKKE